MDFWEHRAVQDKCDLADLKSGRVRDDEDPPEEMDRTRLSPRQMLALKAFHAGSSLKDAAKAAGVSRQTLHRWRTIYHSFSRAMEVWEEGQMIVARSRLVDMADNAIDALAQTIEDGNARAAMMVLRSLQILRTYAPIKPPAEGAAREPRHTAIPLPHDSGAPVGGDRAAGEQVAVDSKTITLGSEVAEAGSQEQEPIRRLAIPAGAAAQHVKKISDRPGEKPKSVILTGKAGLAIKKACDIALQGVTGFDQMLRASHA